MKFAWMIALLIVLVPSTGFSGKLYRWTDAQGNVHFGDIPRTSDAKELNLPPPSSDAGSTNRLDSQMELLKSWEEEREAKQKARAKDEAKEAKREANCRAAKRRLNRALTSKYLYEVNDDGSRKVLSFEERDRAKKDARKDVDRFCD